MEEQNKRKGMVYLVIGLVTLIALVVGATYAYFQAVTGNTATANLNATSGSTDNLTFTIDDLNVETTKITDGDTSKDIIINATQQNFSENGKSIGDGITGKAILVANNTTNETEAYPYYVYVNITENGLKYSSYTKAEEEPKVYKTEEAKTEAITKGELTEYKPVPELVMTVKKNGTEYQEEITGLEKTTITTKEGEVVKGYDITEKSGAILISSETIQVTTEEHDQEKDNTKTDTWEISIVLVNLNTDQELNTGKKVTGEVLIQKEKMKEALDILIADANKEGQTPTLYYHDGVPTNSGSDLEAGDYSYRYSRASEDVHNYVCFGGDCSNNPEEEEKYSNLYRIIGMFPTEETKNEEKKTYQLKIIKADATTEKETGGTGVGAYKGFYGSASTYKGKLTVSKVPIYYWNNETNNTDWSQSNLNTKNLNETYLNYIKETEDCKEKDECKWYNMIEDHTWTTAGNDWEKIGTQNAKTAYENEIKTPAIGTALSSAAQTHQARVGLMYVSDYMYAASKDYWTKIGYNSSATNDYRTAINNNWMYMGLSEWMITRRADYTGDVFNYSGDAFNVNNGGNVGLDIVDDLSNAVRPVLYLNSNVKIIDGNGTTEKPYIISE